MLIFLIHWPYEVAKYIILYCRIELVQPFGSLKINKLSLKNSVIKTVFLQNVSKLYVEAR